MDDDTIQAEEELQVRRAQRATQDALRAAARLEQELMELRMTKFNK